MEYLVPNITRDLIQDMKLKLLEFLEGMICHDKPMIVISEKRMSTTYFGHPCHGCNGNSLIRED